MKNNKYFLISVFITCSLMLINKSNIFQKFHISGPLRDLYTYIAKEYSCEKAGSRLTEKYTGGFDEETGEPKDNLSEAEQSLVDFIRHSTYSNIKPYLKRCGIYIAFLCLAVLFIIFWISYCSCCCCNCLLFSKLDKTPGSLQTIFYIIGVITNLLVIAFSIVVLCLISPFFSRLNGLFCSTLILFDHLNEGLNPDYPPYSNTWVGLGGVSQKFNQSATKIGSIDNDKVYDLYSDAVQTCNNTYSKITEDTTNNTCICLTGQVEEDLTDYNYFYLLTQGFNLLRKVMGFLDSKKIIDESKIDVNDDIYNFLHDYANKHIKRACIAVFTITLIFGILGIAFLSLYYFIKSEMYRIIYIIIWNISMLISILAIIISAIYGVIGYVFSDSVQVIHFTLSDNNILSDDPIIFKKKHNYLSIIINTCANGEGHLLDMASEEFEIMINDLKVDFSELMKEINETCKDEVKEKLAIYYTTMLNNVDILFSSISELLNISCAFAKNDKNIILNEIRSAGKRATVISTFQFLIGVLLAISILVGILFVHKYNYNINNKVNVTDVTSNTTQNDNNYNGNKSFENMNK